MANGHGGARVGSGRKSKALSDKLLEGNRGHETLSKIEFDDLPSGEPQGEDMPEIADFLKQKTKNATTNLAPQIYESTWKWLRERSCDQLVKKELIEQYALYIARWIQCEEGVNTFGLLAKHPTTNLPIASPYVSMGVNFLKQANIIWLQIWQVVKENCMTPIGNDPNDDMMEKLLSGKL